MKKQDIVVFITALVMMISCAALSFGQTMLEEYNLSEYTSKYGNILPIGVNNEGKAFGPAVQEGNLQVVKYLVETYPWLNLLKQPIQSQNSKETQPICIAAEKGYTDMVAFMVENKPELLKINCEGKGKYQFNPKNQKPIWVATENGHINTVMTLLSLKSPVTVLQKYGFDDEHAVLLCLVAKVFKEEKDLKQLIPALLEAGENPNQVSGYCNSWSADAFLFAAQEKNGNFVRILRDEMKKMDKPLVSYYYKWECDPYYMDYLAEYQRLFKNEIEFLQQYGIGYKYGFKQLPSDYCYD